MGQQVNIFSELNQERIGEVKAKNKSWKVKYIRPEVKWANHEQVEVWLKAKRRTELTSVAKDGDDLWLGVKGQSNLRIAGSLRNSCRWIEIDFFIRGRVCLYFGDVKILLVYLRLSNLNKIKISKRVMRR